MAITIRNQRLEAAIQQLGRETGDGPSAVIARLVEAEQQRRDAEREQRRVQREARVRGWLASLPPVTDDDRAAINQIMEDMYDDWGLPK